MYMYLFNVWKETEAMGSPNSRLLYKVETAANLCDMGRSKFWEMVRSGEIQSLKIGKSRRIPAKALEELIQRKLEEQE